MSDFDKIWCIGSLLVSEGPAIIEIHVYLEIQDGGRPPNFQSLNRCNSGRIDRFRSNLAQSFSKWQPIHSFKIKGSTVKVTAQGHSVSNRQYRFTPKMCRIFLPIYALRGRRDLSTCMVARRNFPKRAKTQYFRTKNSKTQKMLIIRQNDWRVVGRPLSCNAFAIARFLVTTVGMSCDVYAVYGLRVINLAKELLVKTIDSSTGDACPTPYVHVSAP